jgi:hypothetical protein
MPGVGAWENYWYIASEWSTSGGLVILLEIERPEAASSVGESPNASAVHNRTDQSRLDQSDREFFLDLYRWAVRRYKPIIEKRTGVRLGDVEVKPITSLRADIVAGMRAASRFSGRLRSERFERQAVATADAVVARMGFSAACYWYRSIYVSFVLGTQFHEDEIIRTTVHELAHCLWHRLAGRGPRFLWRRKRRLQELKMLGEGFAVYGDRIWFSDSYPPGLKKKLASQHLDESDLYIRGLRVIERLVDRYGSEVLLRIPANWRKLIRPLQDILA